MWFVNGDKTSKALVSASIVLYKTDPRLLDRVLACVLSSSVDKLWIIDHSPAKCLDYKLPDSDRIVYKRARNRGYGAGNNIAINESIKEGFKYHLVLNPDVYWKGDIISELIRFMDANPDVALVMPRVYYPDGEFQYQARLLPTPADLFFRRVNKNFNRERHVDRYELRHADWDKIINAPFLSGCFMFLRNEVLKEIGGFDERFFMYHEDMDFTRRLHSRGRTVYYPAVSIYHNLERASSKSLKLFFIHVVSMLKYFNKWGWFSDPKRDEVNNATLARIAGDKNN